MIEAYLVHLLIIVLIYAVLAIALQLSLGFTGLLNLGHIAFFGIGAYASALLALHGFPFWICFLAAGIVSALAGLLLSIPTHRLKGDYLALATFGFSLVMLAIAINWTELTRGPLGLPGIPRPDIFGMVLTDNVSFLVLTAVVFLVSLAIIWRLVHSPFGRLLQAVRDDEIAAQSLGKNAFRVKATALLLSAFFAGIAGSLYAHYITFIDPFSFTILELVPILSIVMVGGLASIEGTLAATVILVLLPEPLRFIGFPSSMVGPMRQIIYALLVLAILLYKPKGFFGKVQLA